jgi:hypothetical protein
MGQRSIPGKMSDWPSSAHILPLDQGRTISLNLLRKINFSKKIWRMIYKRQKKQNETKPKITPNPKKFTAEE